MVLDPRSANCKAFSVNSAGEVTGVELRIDSYPATPYELIRVELIDEPTNGIGGPTVATCTVLDRNGVQLGERVYLAWPYPNMTDKALPGNPNGQHMIANKYWPPNLGPLALYVGDANGQIMGDVVGGLGLPMGHHVSFRATWKERGSTPTPDPEPDPDPDPAPTGDLAETNALLVDILDALTVIGQHIGAKL